MCKHLVETFAQVLEGSENDEKAITAMGLLNTMETILTVMEDNEELHAQLGMISHNKSLITIFGHKHFMQKFDNFHEKISTASDFGSDLVSNFKF